jgi:hypothetical protein
MSKLSVPKTTRHRVSGGGDGVEERGVSEEPIGDERTRTSGQAGKRLAERGEAG